MAETLKAKYNEDGKITVTIFKNEIDITDKIKDGVAHLNLYGKDYEVRAPKQTKKISVKKAKDNGKEVDVGFIESPDED